MVSCPLGLREGAMASYRQPDEIRRIPAHGHEVVTYSFGTGDEVIFCLNGGPGLPCDYIRDSHSRLASGRYRLVIHDQLGCGASDRPDDDSLWTLERYVEEAEIVRCALGLGPVHLLGHSWGAWLSLEYALTYPDAFKTLILVGGTACMSQYIGELERLRGALGSETVAMMQRHEAEGTFDHPEYKAALTILAYRHLSRLQIEPEEGQRSGAGFNPAPFKALLGGSDYHLTGSLRDWACLDRLHHISQPAFVLCGLHDVITPACSDRIHRALSDSRIRVFQNSSHSAFWEEPDSYFAELQSFLDAHSE